MPEDTLTSLPLAVLLLDPMNPRLPPEFDASDVDELLRHIAERYNTIDVGASIARHGYFLAEPLIVLETEDGAGDYIVVEGNRRVVSLRILQTPELSSGLSDEARWRDLAAQATGVLPETYPVMVAASRERVAAIIGYRHITGIEEWEPFQKARFIATLVDERDMQLEEVADLIGETTTEVRSAYRNYRVLHQASAEFGIDYEPVRSRFGVFTRAMTQTAIRAHIGAPAPATVVERADPLDSSAADHTEELTSFLFGGTSGERVISDSRQIPALARVLGDDEALAVLRSTRSLPEAEKAIGGRLSRLRSRLIEARNSLTAAGEDIEDFRDDDDISDLLREIEGLVSDLGGPSGP